MPGIKCGEKYIVHTTTGRCTALVGIFHGFPFLDLCHCSLCGEAGTPYNHYLPWRFIKLDGSLLNERIEDEVTA